MRIFQSVSRHSGEKSITRYKVIKAKLVSSTLRTAVV